MRLRPLPDHHPFYMRCDVRYLRQVQAILRGRSVDLVYHLEADFGRHNGEDYYENLWQTNAVGHQEPIGGTGG